MIWKSAALPDPNEVNTLEEHLQVPKLIAQLLAQRQLTTFAAVRRDVTLG